MIFYEKSLCTSGLFRKISVAAILLQILSTLDLNIESTVLKHTEGTQQIDQHKRAAGGSLHLIPVKRLEGEDLVIVVFHKYNKKRFKDENFKGLGTNLMLLQTREADSEPSSPSC